MAILFPGLGGGFYSLSGSRHPQDATWTIMLRVRFASLSLNDTPQRVLWINTTDDLADAYAVGVIDGDLFSFGYTIGYAQQDPLFTYPAEVDRNYHIAVVFEAGVSSRVYIDGQLVHTGTANSFVPEGLALGGLNLGGDWQVNAAVSCFRYYTSALTQAQIRAEMLSPLPVSTTNLWESWRLAEYREDGLYRGDTDSVTLTSLSGTETTVPGDLPPPYAHIIATADVPIFNLSATPGPQSLGIEVSPDAQIALFFWRHSLLGGAGAPLVLSSSFTDAPTTLTEQWDNTMGPRGGIAWAPVTSFGSGHTVTPVFPATRQTYSPMFVVFLSGLESLDPADWLRDVGSERQHLDTPATVVLNTGPDDIVLACHSNYNGSTTPTTPAGWTEISSQAAIGGDYALLRRADAPGSPTTTVTTSNPYYSLLVAISIRTEPPEGGGGSIIVTGIESAEAFGSLAIAKAAPQDIDVTGIPTDEAFGNLTLEQLVQLITPAGVTSLEAFGSPALDQPVQDIVVNGVPSAEAFGTPTVEQLVQLLAPTGVASAEAFGTLSVEQLVQLLAPTGVASAEAFGTPSVEQLVQLLAPAGVASAEAFGTLSVEQLVQMLAPTGVASAEAFGGHTVANASQILSVSGITSLEAFGTAVVANADAQSLSVTGIASAETFGAQILANAEVKGIVPTGVASLEAFGTAAIADVQLLISPTSIASAEAFGSHVLGVEGLNMVSPFGVPSAEAFGDTTLALMLQTITPGGVASAEAFGTLTISVLAAQSIEPTGVTSAESFGTAVLDQPTQTIAVIGIESLEAFGSVTLDFAIQTIAPNGIPSAAAFGRATLEGGVPVEQKGYALFVPLTQPLFVSVWRSLS